MKTQNKTQNEVSNDKGENEMEMASKMYSKFVHEFTDEKGNVRYAVADYDEKRGQYKAPLDRKAQRLTGCIYEFAKTPQGIGGYPTRRQALRRARYLFGYLYDQD